MEQREYGNGVSMHRATRNDPEGTRLQLAKRFARDAVFVLLLAAIAVPETAEADAATSGPYVSASVVESSMDLEGLGDRSSMDDPKFGDEQSTGWSVGGGYRFSRYLAIEVGRMDLGDKTFVSETPVLLSLSNTIVRRLVHTRVESKGAYVALIGSISINDHWEPYATFGRFRAETKSTLRARTTPSLGGNFLPSEFETSLSDNTTETLFALGLRYTIGNHYAIGLEAMAIPDLGSEEVTDEGDLKSLSVGFQYRF
jgi:hypothetical protein